MIRVSTVQILGGHRLRLGFTDGSEGVVDVAPYLRGPIFEPLREDPDLFAAVEVDDELGTIVWPNGADLDPDVLYEAAVQDDPSEDEEDLAAFEERAEEPNRSLEDVERSLRERGKGVARIRSPMATTHPPR